MSQTRRGFLQATFAAAGVTGATVFAAPEQPPAGSSGVGNRGQGPGSGQQPPQPETPPKPASEVLVPKMTFGRFDISRLICGCNCFYGYAHFNRTLGTVMREYYTPERVCDVLHQCNRFGINAFNFLASGRGTPDLDRFLAEGGAMHLIVQGQGDQTDFIKKYKPMAIYNHGEMTDRSFQSGQLDTVREWVKQNKDLGLMVGVGTHKPEVIAEIESQGWDVDFYAGCVYNRTRTQDEWRKVLGGELVEMQGECYLQSDPPKMYAVMRSTKRPCFAFKILAAGRVSDPEQAFRTAYQSIKPTDGVFVGLFPRAKDEVRENAEMVHRLLVGA
jgi:hypothetical protein